MENIIFLIIILVLFPVFVSAAILSLDPSEGNYYQGDTFMVEIKIDAEDECINTVKGELKYSQEILEAVDFSQGSSIISLWLERPKINQQTGKISFSGGIPGGYCGTIFGLGKIIFRAKESFPAEVRFLDTSLVLLNDGLGTEAKLTSQGAVFDILTKLLRAPEDEWQKELVKDTIVPEPFEIEINQSPSIFEGKYFISFSTVDKQTGVNFYQVKEGKDDWGKVTSPYLLKDQKLKSIIKVKAVDKAGNERIAEYVPRRRAILWWVIVLVLISIGIILWILKKFKLAF